MTASTDADGGGPDRRRARRKAALWHAARVHDEAARTHADAARLFDRLGDGARAAREREKAQHERTAASADRERGEAT